MHVEGEKCGVREFRLKVKMRGAGSGIETGGAHPPKVLDCS